jgi:hypothetical protein
MELWFEDEISGTQDYYCQKEKANGGVIYGRDWQEIFTIPRMICTSSHRLLSLLEQFQDLHQPKKCHHVPATI